MADGTATPRGRKARAPTSASPIDIAMEADSEGSAARRLLVNQNRLVQRQTASETAGLVLKVMTGAGVLAAVVALALMAWSASKADGLVVEAFTVPPDMAAKGLTGAVVARQVLDRVSRMQDEDDSFRARKTSAYDFGDQARVEIPTTGVSIGELQRWLREWLGDERRVTGELFRTPDGLNLTVRVSGAPAETTAGTEAKLDALFDGGADRLYSRADPLRYARNLSLRDAAAARAWLAPLMETGPAADRAYATLVMGNVTDGHRERLELYHRSMALDPDGGTAGLTNAANALQALGWDEQALDYFRRGRVALKDNEDDLARRMARQADFAVASLLGDFSRAYGYWMDGPNTRRTNVANAPATRARTLARMHEPMRALETLDEAPAPAARAWAYREMGDWAETERQLRAAVAEGPREGVPDYPKFRIANLSTNPKPRLAEALAAQGKFAEAQAMIAETPLDCHLCVRLRGRVAALAGNARHADHWYAEAAKMAPSLPLAEAEWAEVLLARGEIDRAIEKLTAANRKGPRYSDVYELWGEALLAKGDAAGAAVKFAEAAKLTPKWGRLHLKWGEALSKAGKAQEARAHWKTAAGLFLTAAERAELARLQGIA